MTLRHLATSIFRWVCDKVLKFVLRDSRPGREIPPSLFLRKWSEVWKKVRFVHPFSQRSLHLGKPGGGVFPRNCLQHLFGCPRARGCAERGRVPNLYSPCFAPCLALSLKSEESNANQTRCETKFYFLCLQCPQIPCRRDTGAAWRFFKPEILSVSVGCLEPVGLYG